MFPCHQRRERWHEHSITGEQAATEHKMMRRGGYRRVITSVGDFVHLKRFGGRWIQIEYTTLKKIQGYLR